MSLINPVANFNFLVCLTDSQGPGVFGLEAGGVAGTLVQGAASLVGQFLIGGFAECDGLNAELEIETYQEGGRNARPYRFVKYGRYPNVVLRRGVSPNTDLWDWNTQLLDGVETQIRKNGLIILLDKGGGVAGIPGINKLPVAAWIFYDGVPERLVGPSLNAKGNEIAIEALEISHERLERVSLAMIPGLADFASSIGAALSLAGGAALGGAAAAGVDIGF